MVFTRCRHRVRMDALSALVVILVSAGCGNAVTGTPPPATGAAIDMAVKRVSCRTGVQATACFQVTMTNRGTAPGDGTCTLLGETHRTVYPGNTGQSGMRFHVAHLIPGGSITRTAIWVGRKRD